MSAFPLRVNPIGVQDSRETVSVSSRERCREPRLLSWYRQSSHERLPDSRAEPLMLRLVFSSHDLDLQLAIHFSFHGGSLPENTAGGQPRFGAKSPTLKISVNNICRMKSLAGINMLSLSCSPLIQNASMKEEIDCKMQSISN